jgi:hypothetical protein
MFVQTVVPSDATVLYFVVRFVPTETKEILNIGLKIVDGSIVTGRKSPWHPKSRSTCRDVRKEKRPDVYVNPFHFHFFF